MSILKTVGMELIHPNPFRMLDNYPWIEEKLEALQRSIEDVGFWEGIIARPNPDGKGYQIAFGHHRIEAAKRAGLNKADLIVRDLTDEQMIQFMGRENGEDYKADFLTMLNTWEGAVEYVGHDSGHTATDIAKLLGWTRNRNDQTATKIKVTPVAEACAHAHKLISEGHMTREDFTGLSVSAVRDLAARTQQQIKRAEASTAKPEQVKKAAGTVAKGAKITARKIREGKVAQRDIKSNVTKEARRVAAYHGKNIPLFEDLAKTLCNQLDRILAADAHAEKLNEILKDMKHIQLDSDRKRVDAIRYALNNLAARAEKFSQKLQTKAKQTQIKQGDVVQIKALTGGKS